MEEKKESDVTVTAVTALSPEEPKTPSDHIDENKANKNDTAPAPAGKEEASNESLSDAQASDNGTNSEIHQEPVGLGQKFRNFRQRVADQREQRRKDIQAKVQVEEEAQLQAQQQQLRPALMSVSVVRDKTNLSSKSWGLELKQLFIEQQQEEKVVEEATETNEEAESEDANGNTETHASKDGATTTTTTTTGAMVPSGVEIAGISEDGLLHGTNLQVGDKLVTVNNRKCVEVEQVMEQLAELPAGTTFFVAETPVGNPRLVQATVRKPALDSLVGIEFINEVKQGTELLLIKSVSSQGLLSHSVLNQGQLVLTINSTFCGKMNQEEAADLIKNTEGVVSITAMKPSTGEDEDVDDANLTRAQRWMKGAKRAGVAVGGGVMVGVGLVFIPTLPPPFGEVLIVGGVSVLGTEFEAPKRFMRNTRDSLARAVGPAEEEGETVNGEQMDSIPEGAETGGIEANLDANGNDDQVLLSKASTVSEGSESSAKPRKTMKTRFKNFGRNVVLPFLDQVVGDKPHGENQNEGKDANAEIPEPREICAEDQKEQEGESKTQPEPVASKEEIGSADTAEILRSEESSKEEAEKKENADTTAGEEQVSPGEDDNQS